MDLTKKLSENFVLGELLITEHLDFLDENQNPPLIVVTNLQLLVDNILQPIRTKLGYSLHVNSGYRCLALNKAVGGAANSQHIIGQAADLVDNTNGNLYLFEAIKNSGLPFDLLITECPDANCVPAWVHVSYDATRSRKMILKAKITGHNTNGSPIFEYENY